LPPPHTDGGNTNTNTKGDNTMEFWDFFFIFFIFIPLTIAWVYTVVDIFMRPDVGALGKFGWLLLALFLPLLGMLIYFMVRPDDFVQEVDAI